MTDARRDLPVERPGGGSAVASTAEQRALLRRVHASLAQEVDGLVDRFYQDLVDRKPVSDVLARLQADEIALLKNRQGEHLLTLVDPDLDPGAADDRARRVGQVQALVGVDIEWYVEAMSTHHQQVLELAERSTGPEDLRWLYAFTTQRLMRDLQSALGGYRDVEVTQHQVLARVHEAVDSAGTVPDLVSGVLRACSQMEGLTAGFFGRPDVEGNFQFELGIGESAEEFLQEMAGQEPLLVSVLDTEPQGRGMAGRAWRAGRIQRTDSFLTDPTTEPWHTVGKRLGWRSGVWVPLMDANGQPRAMVAFYSAWPGFFAPAARQAMVRQVRTLLERALGTLERRGTFASGVRTYSARSAYLSRLHQGEVEMLFQPIVELATGRVTKLEGLARLRDDSRLVLPGEFLPAFGDEELIRLFDLGLEQALASLRAWDAEGVSLGVSLNLPAISSRDERYATLVEQALVRHRVAPTRLTLELLETGYVDGLPRWRGPVLDQLKTLGVRLAQDDLGSGYSSLLRLRHLAFDDVKLDQSLVRGQEFDPRGALNFIYPLTSLVRSMGLNVVVEGLENQGLIEAALMLGADEGQGYGISRPLTSGAVPAWVKQFVLAVDAREPQTPLGALAAHVAWEHKAHAMRVGQPAVTEEDAGECLLDRYIERVGDPGGHLAEVHASVHRASFAGRGSAEHMRWWRVLTKMLGGL